MRTDSFFDIFLLHRQEVTELIENGVGKIHKNSSLWAVILSLLVLALAVLSVSATAQENTTDHWMNIARAFSLNGSNEQAVSAYDELLKIDPENMTAWSYKALELQTLGKENESALAYERALCLMEEKLKKNPEDARTWYLKSLALESLGRPQDSLEAQDKALQLYNRSLELDPKNATSWRGKAEILYRTGKTYEGLQALDRALDVNPNDIDILSRKGEFLEFMGKYNESLEVFDRVLELMPVDDVTGRVEIWMAKVQTLHFAGRRDEAIAAQEKVTELDPKNLAAWRIQAGFLGEAGRYNESLEAYEQALNLDPDDVQTWNEKASLLARAERYNESLEAYDRAIDLMANEDSKELALAWEGKGDAFDKTGRRDLALTAFGQAVNVSEKALIRDSGDISLMLQMARALFKSDRLDEAIKSYDRAIEMASLSDSFYATPAWIGKGDALRAQGKNVEALEAYNRSIEQNPIYGDAWYGRSESQRALGLVQDAYESSYVAEKLGYKT